MTSNLSPRLAPLQDRWRQFAPRERAMLALMGVAIAAFVLWYGLYAPLRQAHADARARHVAAAATLAQVRAGLAHLAQLQDQLPAPPSSAEALKQALQASAAGAGLRLDQLREDGSGGLELESGAATPAQLFGWLDALRREHGLAPATLSVARNRQRLRVQARFEPATP